MKFVFVSYNYNPRYTSPQKWFDRITGYMGVLTELSKHNHVTRIKQIGYEGEEIFNGVHFKFVNYHDSKLRFPRKLHGLIKSLDPDVVVVHGLHNPLQVIQLHFTLNKKTKIIAQNHAEKPSTGIKKILQKIADRYIDAYLFASRTMGEGWVESGNLTSAKKVHEVMEVSSIFYPIEKEQAVAKTGVTANPAFLWVARLNQIKDPLTVIKAFIAFVKICPSARLYMIYHTEDLIDDIGALLKEHDVADTTITLIGKVPNQEMLYWYNSVDFIISGSHYEGSGTAVCEALSCGCVPIVTDIFSFRMITDNGSIGFLYEPGNVEELLAALIQTQQMNMPEQREKALAYFKSTLSFEAIAGRIQEIATAL